MAPYTQTFKLNTGASIPAVGLGTWQASQPGEAASAVKTALQAGYRHIDGAWIYGNEPEVGQGLKESGVPREEVFVTTKLWCTKHDDPEKALDESLENLGLEYVDLYLMHWPLPMNPNGNDPKFPRNEDGSRDIVGVYEEGKELPFIATWKRMEKLLDTGKVRAIGVSNVSVPWMKALLKDAKVVPAVNQIELHPYLPQHDLVEFCHSNGIICTAYSPLGSTGSPLLSDADIKRIAEKHNTGPGNVCIAYQVHRGVSVLPKSVTESRIKSNFEDVSLDEEDMKTLNGLYKERAKRYVKPDWGSQCLNLGFEDWDKY
ncbi:hypothetical protein YB2330_003916 [Saitoella coloradoensis]